MDLEGEPKTTPSIPTGFRVTQQFITPVPQVHATHTTVSAEGAVRPGPATSFQFKFETAGPQVAPPPVEVPKQVDLLSLAIRSSQHRDDVINDLLDWYTIDLGEKGPLVANFRCLKKIGAVFIRDLLRFITDLRIGRPR